MLTDIRIRIVHLVKYVQCMKKCSIEIHIRHTHTGEQVNRGWD